jgi:hypothetical protein
MRSGKLTRCKTIGISDLEQLELVFDVYSVQQRTKGPRLPHMQVERISGYTTPKLAASSSPCSHH